jgi:hypothetical protein
MLIRRHHMGLAKELSGMDMTTAVRHVQQDYRRELRELREGEMSQKEFERIVTLEALALKAQQVDACWGAKESPP